MDSALLRMIRETPGTGKVHSVFGRAINILAPWGQLLTLAARQLDDAPWIIRAEIRDWSSTGIQPGDPVTLSERRVSFESSEAPTVFLPGAREWVARKVSLENLSRDELDARSSVLAELLDAHGVRGGILEDQGHANPFDAEIAAGLRNGREALVAAIRAKDTGRISEAVLQLLGLGPGLTPAGDDFLSGLALLAAQPGSKLGGFRAVLTAVVGQYPERTTLLSVTTMQEALDGRARECLLELLSQLVRRDAENHAGLARILRAPVDRALGIGHTSGTDILSGILAGLRLETELRGSM